MNILSSRDNKQKISQNNFCSFRDIENKRNPGFLEFSYLNKLLSKKYIIWEKNVNVVKWINSCSSFVLPSYRKVFKKFSRGNGCWQINNCTNVPGCRETVIEGENGFLIPGDIKSLVECMEYLILNPKHNKIMGQRSNIIAKVDFPINYSITKSLNTFWIKRKMINLTI